MVCDGKTLVQDTDYTVTYKNNQDIGTADVVLHGTGKYIGTITIHFQIYCGHKNLMHTSGKAATCTEAGNIEYWNCAVCRKYFRDSEGRQEILLANTVIPAGHQLSKTDSKAATCTEAGNIEYWNCAVCRKYFRDSEGRQEILLANTVIPAGHQLSKTDSKAATCTEAGNTEYWTCNACGKYFSDEAGTNETRLADTVIPATGHHYGEYQLTKEATALEEGVRTAYCSCGAYVTAAVPALTPSIKLNVSRLRLRVKQRYTVKVTGLAKGELCGFLVNRK